MSCAGMNAGSQVAALYRAVKLAGAPGISSAALRQQLAAQRHRTIESGLLKLKAANFIAHDPATRSYRVDACCLVPNIRQTQHKTIRGHLLALIGDCEAGISAAVLQTEACVTERQVLNALRPLLADGRLVRVLMPEKYGGSWGFRPGGLNTAQHLPGQSGDVS